MALEFRIKSRAQREITRAVEWWSTNRPSARGALLKDIEEALVILVEQPALGTKVETGRPIQVRRLFLDRTSYHLYYRVRADALEVLSLWHSSREHDPSV